MFAIYAKTCIAATDIGYTCNKYYGLCCDVYVSNHDENL